LVANWTAKRALDSPSSLVVVHFIGATPSSSSVGSMLRRIVMEIADFYEIDRPIPTNPKDLIQQFPEWLIEANLHGYYEIS
jgi:hypothetical protein